MLMGWMVYKLQFQVGPGDDYVLTVGGYDAALSSLGDALAANNGMKFSTK